MMNKSFLPGMDCSASTSSSTTMLRGEDLSMWIHRETRLADDFSNTLNIDKKKDFNNGPLSSWMELSRGREWLRRDTNDANCRPLSDEGLSQWLDNNTKPLQKEEQVLDPKLRSMLASAIELELWLTPKQQQSAVADDLARWLASNGDSEKRKKSVMGKEDDSASSIVVIDHHDDFVMTEDDDLESPEGHDKQDLGFWLL